ncbi:MAG TPA: alpha-E domain-containing protein [Opitutaceae bacterium]|nr:alpha-E domain-containing protein [Opitutaceae bacterium]
MLSRVANLVYWMARYLERAENTARIVDVNAALVLDLQSRRDADDPKSWESLLYVSGGEELFGRLYDEVSERTVVEFMLFERRNPGSIFSCISQARENARCIRDQIASEVWEHINTFYLKLRDDDYARYAQLGPFEYLSRIKTQSQLLYGIAESMLPRNHAWWFFELGRFLERADNVSRILDVKYFMLLPALDAVGSALDIIQWASVLRSCSGFEAFRKSRRGQLNLERVVDYLMLDDAFPRSIYFSVREAEHALAQITAEIPHVAENAATTLVAELRAELEQLVVREVIASGLHEYLDHIQAKVAEVHEAVQNVFITYPTAGAYKW